MRPHHIATLTLALLSSNVTLPVHAGMNRRAGEVWRDEMIATKLHWKYTRDTSIDAQVIDTQVFRGVVTLRGHVAGADAAARAEQIARRTPGVTLVDNQLVAERGGVQSGIATATTGGGKGAPLMAVRGATKKIITTATDDTTAIDLAPESDPAMQRGRVRGVSTTSPTPPTPHAPVATSPATPRQPATHIVTPTTTAPPTVRASTVTAPTKPRTPSTMTTASENDLAPERKPVRPEPKNYSAPHTPPATTGHYATMPEITSSEDMVYNDLAPEAVTPRSGKNPTTRAVAPATATRNTAPARSVAGTYIDPSTLPPSQQTETAPRPALPQWTKTGAGAPTAQPATTTILPSTAHTTTTAPASATRMDVSTAAQNAPTANPHSAPASKPQGTSMLEDVPVTARPQSDLAHDAAQELRKLKTAPPPHD